MRRVRITENHELRRMDSMNWRLYERRPVVSGPRCGLMEWMPCDAYFGRVADAVRYVYHDACRNRYETVEADLAGALDVMRAIEREIGRHAERFERAERGE